LPLFAPNFLNMAEDYYATLGVSRTATADDISKAYRQLARKHHPDMNPDDPTAKEKFQRVQQAFDVLNDPKKRESYDRYGVDYDPTAGPSPGSGPRGSSGGWAPSDGQNYEVNFEDLFGGGNQSGSPFGGGFADLFKQFGQRGKTAGGRRATSSAGANLEHEIQVPFNTAILGGETQFAVERTDGRTETIRVKIPAGIEPGKKIRVRGQGEPGVNGGRPGDILIRVQVAPHPVFRRTGNRIDVTLPITLSEALRGAKVDLPTPHGTITLTIPPGSSGGAKLRVKGQGVRSANGPPGDLFAELQIELPKKLTDADREQLADIAGKYDDTPRADLRW
jgi:DnaJ-class molecular chaperone